MDLGDGIAWALGLYIARRAQRQIWNRFKVERIPPQRLRSLDMRAIDVLLEPLKQIAWISSFDRFHIIFHLKLYFYQYLHL